ncbi:MAG: hypothetical protein GY862_09880 [Gammaproteobacteria bacterium]|nr:hypothetical protein [Gammaproteobacteria bacterium]
MKINWHHLFGWTLTDYFFGTSYSVDLEKELSVKPQLLDVIIIENSSGLPLTEPPDGLEHLSRHNLLTYKSLRETLDTLVIMELLGHYVNYRKLLDPNNWNKLPLSEFQLYAVTTRYPHKLKREFKSRFQDIKAGVCDLAIGSCTIRIIALNRIPETEKNAVWQLFSSDTSNFEFGSEHYHWHYPPAATLLRPLFTLHNKEKINMPLTLEEAAVECARYTMNLLPPAERLKGMSLPEIIKQFPPAKVVKQFSPAEVIKQFSPAEVIKQFSPAEVIKQFSPAEVLEQLSAEEIEEYQAKLEARKSRAEVLEQFSAEEIEECLAKLKARKS